MVETERYDLTYTGHGVGDYSVVGFMDIIKSTAPKSLTSDTTFSNYLLIVDAYSKIPKLSGMENITTAEVMDKLDMFQSRYEKIDQLGWWDL